MGGQFSSSRLVLCYYSCQKKARRPLWPLLLWLNKGFYFLFHTVLYFYKFLSNEMATFLFLKPAGSPPLFFFFFGSGRHEAASAFSTYTASLSLILLSRRYIISLLASINSLTQRQIRQHQHHPPQLILTPQHSFVITLHEYIFYHS